MESQRMIFKWSAIMITVGMFLSFAFALPSASAQEENPLTPTPVGSIVTPGPIQPPETLQGNESQEMRQMQTASAPLAEEWSTQADISYTAIQESSSPKIASDINGVEHFVWSETVGEGKQEIFYSQISDNPDIQVGGVIQSLPVNVSNSSSFSSTSPQIVVDNNGTAHIVWQDKDGTDHYEVFYSHCDLDTPKTMTFATSPKNDFSV